MKTRAIALALTLAIAALCALSAWRAGAATEQPGVAAERSYSLRDIAFITGSWSGELFRGVGEEHWTAPGGGTMLGVFRLIHGERTTITEYLLIQQTNDGVIYRFKHFSPDYHAREPQPLTFRLAEVKGQRAVFISDDESQKPYKLVYAREGDSLNIDVLEMKDGEEKGFTAEFTRMD